MTDDLRVLHTPARQELEAALDRVRAEGILVPGTYGEVIDIERVIALLDELDRLRGKP